MIGSHFNCTKQTSLRMEEVTLLFRHLPVDLTLEERKDLLLYLGASRVKVMGKSGPQKNTAFAVFPSREQALKVVHELHQAEFLDSRLIVEFAKTELPNFATSTVDEEISKKHKGSADDEGTALKKEESIQQQMQPKEIKFDSTFGLWGLRHPRRPEFRYAYPPPTPSVLANILNALAAVPKFYVQVLHLMNKMDLPAPFGPVTPAPPVRADAREIVLPDDVDQREMEISSESSESELESGEETEKEKRSRDLNAGKRQVKLIKRFRVKRPRLADLQDSGNPGLPSASAVQVADVFEQTAGLFSATKKIELKLPSSVMSVPESKHASEQVHLSHHISESSHLSQPSTVSADENYAQKAPTGHHKQQQQPVSAAEIQLTAQQNTSHQPTPVPPLDQQQLPLSSSHLTDSENKAYEFEPSLRTSHEPETSEPGFGMLLPVVKKQKKEEVDQGTEKEWSRSEFISQSELQRLKLSSSEMKKLSVFNKYSEGETSCRLYIKNLGKNVTEEDLHWIYGRYVDWENESESRKFDIKLMKEGRMKGQAFIHLSTEKSALLALRETNGCMLQDKPMVVQFARSAKVKSEDATKYTD